MTLRRLLSMARTRPGGPIRPIVVLLGSNLLGTATAGVFFLVASWRFTLEQMGVYAVAISIQWVTVGLLGTGLSVAVIRLGTDALQRDDRPAAGGIFLLAVGAVTLIGAGGAAACFLVELWLPGRLLVSGEIMGLILLWAGARAALDCVRSALLAEQRYYRAAALMMVSAVTGLGALGLIVATGPLGLRRMLYAHVLGMGLAVVLGASLLRPLLVHGPRPSRRLLAGLLRYARWPALSEGTRLLQANLGPPLLLALAAPAEAGLFGLGRYPAYIFEVVAVSFYQYWLPAAARQGAHDRLARFLGRQLRLATGVGLAMVAGAIICTPLLPLLGENFGAAAHLFVLNTVDFALFLVVRPIETAFHAIHRPALELIPRVARLGLLFGSAWLLVAPFGAVGMVWAQILSGAAALVIAARVLRGRLDLSSRAIGARSIPGD